MDKINLQVIGLIACILVVVGAYIYVQVESHSESGRLILQCELPTGRPTMSEFAINFLNISNSSEARSFAAQYFPQFSNVTFEEVESGVFEADLNDETITIHSHGGITYNRHLYWHGAVSTEEFLIEVALSSSNSFIERHGGLRDYIEISLGSASGSYPDNPPSSNVSSYNFVYLQRYNGYTIYDGYAIHTEIHPENYTLCYYSRNVYDIGDSIETSHVMSAETAWNMLVEAFDDTEDYNITDVELCYEMNIGTVDEDVITLIYPAWRFSGPDFDASVIIRHGGNVIAYSITP
jgi:hypothetical protein